MSKQWSGDVKGATKTIAKTQSPKAAAAAAAAPVVRKAASLVTMIDDINAKALSFGKVEDGRSGDKFVKISLNEERIVLGCCKLPTFTRIPFDAGPFKGKGGGGDNGNNAWNIHVDLTADQFTEYAAFEEKLKTGLFDQRDEMFPAVKEKTKKSMTKDSFLEKFNPAVKSADLGKGYPARIKVTVPHEAAGFDGKPLPMPHIQTCNMLDDEKTITKRVAGTIHDLTAKAAVVPVFKVVRGIYAGNHGWGMKLTLESCIVIKNRSGDTAVSIDMSDVTELDETAEELGMPSELPTKFEGFAENNGEEGEESTGQFGADGAYPPP